jgi:hypothetical protein|tara:strand:+ start:15325 stop:15516 length:192 start_codon:yes stop_codon:yes gene_type:complete
MNKEELERKVRQYRKLSRIQTKSILKKTDAIWELKFKVTGLEFKVKELEKELKELDKFNKMQS